MRSQSADAPDRNRTRERVQPAEFNYLASRRRTASTRDRGETRTRDVRRGFRKASYGLQSAQSSYPAVRPHGRTDGNLTWA